MRDDQKSKLSVSDLLRHSVEAHDISHAPSTMDELMSGEASSHFPQKRNRRKSDANDEDVRKLQAIFEALDSGSTAPMDDIIADEKPLHTEFYKQF